MSPVFRNALLWLLGSVVMIVAAMSSVSSAFADGHYVPDNADAFYHARRILDSVMTHSPVIQFDSKIHAPEGSWLVWPWGFDTLLATITSWFGPFQNIDQANAVLMNIPPMATTVAVLLVVLLTRQLRLPILHSLVLVLAFAVLPAAFRGFCVGNVDHHSMELTCAIATMVAGAAFFREGNRSPWAPIALGALFGFAVAMQNGLFVLQVPICAMLAFRWIRGQSLPDRRQVQIFAITLFVATLVACLPSQPFRHGFFEFYTLSGFHLYVATVVAVFSVLLSRVAFSRRNLIILMALALVALIPFFGTLYLASSFVTGNLSAITTIIEAQSPYKLYLDDPDGNALVFMSWLCWFMFPMMLVNLWWAWRKQDPMRQYLAIFCVFGLVFFQLQYRFGVYGIVPMLLTPVLFAKEIAELRPRWSRVFGLALPALFIAAYVPTAQAWSTHLVLGNNVAYGNIRSVWPKFSELCKERPGLVLADVEAGHWIRYNTDCSVIANVFLLTPQQLAKVDENTNLLAMTPEQLLEARKDIRYVLVFHAVLLRKDKQGKEIPILDNLRFQMMPMERELLGPEAAIPKQFKKQWEVRSPTDQIYSRLYEIVRD